MDCLRVLNPFIAAENFRTGCRNNVILPTLKETYSQHGEDLIIDSILEIMKCVKGDFGEMIHYVDIGANHPIEISNTYLFYRKHGHGVLFEADPDRLEELNRVRPRDKVVHAAISNHRRPAQTETLHIGNASECSTLMPDTMRASGIPGLEFVGKVEVPSLHVMDAFDQYWPQGPVQLLSIDIEGMDFQVLQAIDWNKYRPWIVCAETSPREVTQPLVLFMQKNGYSPVAMTADNFIFCDW